MRTVPIELSRHPASAPLAITVEGRCVAAPDGGLEIRFELRGDLASIVLPDAGGPDRLDGLWRHTCFEAFVQGCEATGYREFNFSPAGAWQAYAFSAYRQGGPMEHASVPRIARKAGATLGLSALVSPSELPPGRCLRLGLSAVIESVAGTLSYWALRHPAGRPDFHHPDGFALEIFRP